MITDCINAYKGATHESEVQVFIVIRYST